jgi:hypothetical protein
LLAVCTFSAATLAALSCAVHGQTTHPSGTSLSGPALSSGDIVERLVAHNSMRSQQLRGYTDERHYTVSYHGIPASITAAMVVEAAYDAPATKSFRILSSSGSKLLVDRVLKKLLESEKEAAENPTKTAVTPENYTFNLLGREETDGRQSYIFHLEPKRNDKFLYRGKVYVDAEDFAVTRIEAEPAKNPSFWVKKTRIHHLYKKSGQFWLPESNRSESSLRLGGSAVLTIDYGTYRMGGEGTSIQSTFRGSDTR